MSNTNMVLGSWRRDEWPEYIMVSHDGMREPGRKYVPERTCRVEVERRKLSQTQTAVVKSCSECGFKFGVEKEDTFPFEVTLNVVVPPSYCPNCGAKVVE